MEKEPTQENIDKAAENLGVYYLKACENIYGWTKNPKEKNINEIFKNKKIGIAKGNVKRISGIINVILAWKRNGEMDEENLYKYMKKIKYNTSEEKEEREMKEIEKEKKWEKGDNEKMEMLETLWKIRKVWRKNLNWEIKRTEEEKIKIAIENLIKSEETDPKRFYEKMRGVENKRKGIESVKNEEEGIIKIEYIKERVLNTTKKFWEKIFNSKVEKKNDKPYWFNKKSNMKWEESRICREISMKEIQDITENMGNKKAAGTDKIPIELYKDSQPQNIEPLRRIMNTCLKINKMPARWKKGVIFPIFKKEDEQDLANYRPIALLQTQYKIYSAIINKRLTEQMYENNFFSKHQGAWQKDKITTINASAMIQMYEDAKLHKKELHVCYIDLVKAYDSVEHWSLEETMRHYNMGENTIKIIMSLLENTELAIITNHGITQTFKVNRGVR